MFYKILKQETGESQEFSYRSEAIDWAYQHGDGNYIITDRLHMCSFNCRIHAGQLQLEGKEY